MVAKARAKAGRQTTATSTSTSSKEFGYFKTKECLYHNQFGIPNHNSEGKDNRVSPQEGSMVIATIASQNITRQGGTLF